jgi:hypothetical protein
MLTLAMLMSCNAKDKFGADNRNNNSQARGLVEDPAKNSKELETEEPGKGSGKEDDVDENGGKDPVGVIVQDGKDPLPTPTPVNVVVDDATGVDLGKIQDDYFHCKQVFQQQSGGWRNTSTQQVFKGYECKGDKKDSTLAYCMLAPGQDPQVLNKDCFRYSDKLDLLKLGLTEAQKNAVLAKTGVLSTQNAGQCQRLAAEINALKINNKVHLCGSILKIID